MKTINPRVTHGIVHRAVNSFFNYQGWPSVARDKDGTLYAVASGFRTMHVDPFGKTCMYVSRNDGLTWSPPIVLNDTYMDNRDAGILCMGNGRMLVTWFDLPAAYFSAEKANPLNRSMIENWNSLPESARRGGSYIKITEDGGVTWCDPIKIPISTPHGPIQLRDGSLFYLGKEMMWGEEGEFPPKMIGAYKSNDGGYTWQYVGIVPLPDGIVGDNFHEPHVVELPDGRLFGAIRAQGANIKPSGFTIYTTVSEDGGKSWSIPVCLGVSGSPPHLMLHSSGALLCSYGRREKPFGERVLVSRDLGESWGEDYIIDGRANDGDLGYPASVEMGDGSIFTLYYQKAEGDNNCSILFSRWEL